MLLPQEVQAETLVKSTFDQIHASGESRANWPNKFQFNFNMYGCLIARNPNPKRRGEFHNSIRVDDKNIINRIVPLFRLCMETEWLLRTKDLFFFFFFVFFSSWDI